ncbi:MAG: BrnT family toxin [Methylobacter sp.]
MEYGWDKNKAVANLAKHGVSFEEAKTVFDDPLYVDFYDPDHSLGEHRFILLGESAQGRLLFVFYMERNNGIRLIKKQRYRKGNMRKAYEQE